MTQEQKELLLKDLCARLPYGVKCDVYDRIGVLDEISSYGAAVSYNNGEDTTCRIEYVKPCLYPLSSMTEEQKKEYNLWKHEVPTYHYEYGDIVEDVELFDSPESFEYLIKNHFDYRGLIEKGLAIDATGLNIY